MKLVKKIQWTMLVVSIIWMSLLIFLFPGKPVPHATWHGLGWLVFTNLIWVIDLVFGKNGPKYWGKSDGTSMG